MSATLNLPFFHVVSLLGFFEMIIQCIRKKSMEKMKMVWNKRNYLLNYCLAPFRQTYHKIILLEKADVQPWI